MNRTIPALALWLFLLPALHAQPAPDTGGSFLKRFTYGARFSIMPTNLLRGENFLRTETETGADTEVEYVIFSHTQRTNSTSSHLGFGGTVAYAFNETFTLVADVMYRRPSYRFGEETIEGLDDPDTDEEDERIINEWLEQTDASYWDIPVMLRWHESGPNDQLARYFFGGGIAIRAVSGIKTYNEHTLPNNSVESNNDPITPANRVVPGLVASAGFEFGKDRGFKVTPEVRYTRWLRRTFNSNTSRSNPNQLEFLVGITF